MEDGCVRLFVLPLPRLPPPLAECGSSSLLLFLSWRRQNENETIAVFLLLFLSNLFAFRIIIFLMFCLSY